MRHGHTGFIGIDAWDMGLMVLVFILLLGGVFWLIHRKRVASDGLTPIERKELDFPERDILSMLRQHGGPMIQSEIIDTLPGDLDDFAGVMNAMESKGLIQREWRSDKRSYLVTGTKQ